MSNRNLECLVTILRDHGPTLTTAEILSLSEQYPELCKGCSSGTQIILAGRSLVQQQRIQRTVTKGGFLWTIL